MLIDKKTLQKYDKSLMYEYYDHWPETIENSYKLNSKKFNFKKIDHIVFTGMGGSGTIGDVLAAILSKTNMHVTLVKGYTLPKTVSKHSLVITTSVSGDTVETLTILKQAYKQKANIIAFSSGGLIERFCNQKSIQFQKIQKIHSPRTSFLNYLYSILYFLGDIIPISDLDVKNSIQSLKQISKKINSNNLTDSNPSLDIAKFINGIPAIYYPWGLQSAAIRFKNSLQENSKTHSFAEDVIEASHNGIVAWEKISNAQPILIKGKDDNPKTKERWKILEEYFESKQISYKTLTSINGDILSKIVSLIYVLDFASIYLAVSKGIDPTPVKSIDFIKSRLSNP